MSAVTPYLEEPQENAREERKAGIDPKIFAPSGGSFEGLGDLSLVSKMPFKRQALEAMHSELTRMVWVRSALESVLATREVTVYASGKTRKGARFFRLDPPIGGVEVPWFPGATEQLANLELFGEAGKMVCPCWDLPAGAMPVGGTCPGAIAGQTIIDPKVRTANCRKIGGRLFLPVVPPGMSEPLALRPWDAICGRCYAMGGRYPTLIIQAGEIVRYWWARGLLTQGAKGFDEFVSTMAQAIPVLTNHRRTRFDGMNPMRIHSSGDFFSPDYARAWVAIANELWDQGYKSIRLWAPSRTWAHKGWLEWWPGILKQLHGPNLLVRPSAFHVGDPAPEPLAPGYEVRGTTSIHKDDNKGRGADDRYDWNCPVYEIEEGDHTCANARGADGEQGCRVCWTHPHWRINYQTH